MNTKFLNVYKLSDDEKNEMKYLSDLLLQVSPHDHVDSFITIAKTASKSLPVLFKTFLTNFISNNLTDDIAIIQNLPYDVNIQTPDNNNYFIGEKTMLSRCQAIINEYIGEMISYQAEAHGRLFQDMVPNKKLMTTQTSLGSKIELELHTEQAFSDLKPDFLCLSCLKGDENAKTYYLHIDDIIRNLSEEDSSLLKKELWKIGVDLSFIMNGCSSEIRGPVSIINDNNLVFDQDLMVGMSEEAKFIIQKIIDIYYNHRKFHILKPGEALIINNKKLVHGRSSFEPLFDGNDRFIIRSFIMNNIDNIENKTSLHSRMIGLQYS